MIKVRKENVIDSSDLDDLIEKTYNKPYCYQQQDGCKQRGNEYITIPFKYEEEGDTTFKEWLEKKVSEKPDWEEKLDWHRNFYPDLSIIINDLYKKELIEKGKYTLKIDW